MDHSDFVDANGIVWHIFAGLPADFPDTERTAKMPRAGLTFRSSTGEVRVLPWPAIPRRVQMPTPLPAPHGTRAPVPCVEVPVWEQLLRSALVWPPVQNGH